MYNDRSGNWILFELVPHFILWLSMTQNVSKQILKGSKCFKLLIALEKSCYGLNIFMFYTELCIELSVVWSVIYNSYMQNELSKMLRVWRLFSTIKTHFLAKFKILFDSLIYYLQINEKILALKDLGGLVLLL